MMVDAKLDAALRRQQGRKLLGRYLAAAADSLGRPEETLRLAPLDRTDAAFQQFRAAWQAQLTSSAASDQRLSVETSREAELVEHAANLRARMPAVPLLLFRALSQWCGAIDTDTPEVLSRLVHLVTLEQEDLMASTDNGRIGLVCEGLIERHSWGNTPLYRLLAWW